jgi:hypothetical protein
LWFPTSKTSAKLNNCLHDIPQTVDKVCKKAEISGLFEEKVVGKEEAIEKVYG